MKRCCNSDLRQMKSGFTLVELSLSIAFIAILSIAVTLIITNSIASYHRGLTLNNINTTGMDLVDDMRAAVQNAPAHPPVSDCTSIYSTSTSYNNAEGNTVTMDNKALSDCEDDEGHNFVSVTRVGNVKLNGVEIGGVPVFGAFCTGTYSYIWNSGYFSSQSEAEVMGIEKAVLKYKYLSDSGNVSSETATDFRLLKVHDENRAVCISALVVKEDGSIDNRYNITNENPINAGRNIFNIDLNDADTSIFGVVDEPPIDLLMGDTGSNLAIYDLASMTPASNTSMNSLFYSTSFILGTVQGGININAAGNFCATPEGYNSEVENFDYCAINKFNFAAQAIGG